MKLEIEDAAPRYRLLPIQVVSTDNGIILRRGVERFRITGEGVQELLEEVLEAASQEKGATIEELCTLSSELDESDARSIVDVLIQRRFLMEIGDETLADCHQTDEEDKADVFFWQYGSSARKIAERFGSLEIALIGVNHISGRLALSLQQCGFSKVTVVDHPLLRNLRLFDSDCNLKTKDWELGVEGPLAFEEWVNSDPNVNCLVVTSDSGGMTTLREWNDYAVQSQMNFLPVVLQDGIGMIGPLTIPGQTACYECFWSRQNSHMQDPERQRAGEDAFFYGQLVNGYLQPMASVLAEIATMEMVRTFGKTMTPSKPGRLIEIDLTEPYLLTRQVLKVPRCSVCGTLTKQSSRSVDQNVFMLGNEENP